MGESLTLITPPKFDDEIVYVYIDDVGTKARINDSMIVAVGLSIQRAQLTVPEQHDYARYALLIDDGEAQAVAIAQHRGLSILTDDGAGIALAGSIGVPVLTTLDLIFTWAKGRSDEDVQGACKRLRLRGRYAVPKSHVHAAWYREQLDA